MTQESQRRMLSGSRFQVSQGLVTMAIALVALLVLCAVVAPSSVSQGAILGMLPFAAVLGIAGLGQMLVVQQAGFDLSVPGSIGLTVVIVTHVPNGDNSKLFVAVVLAYGLAILAGMLNGFLVGRLGLNAIIATLGTNALLFGVILGVSGGTPRGTTKLLASITGGMTLGIPNAVFIAVFVLILVSLLVKKTVAGRKFEAVGASAPTARALGLRVRTHQGASYLWAQLLYTTAGLVLAGVTAQPTAYLGNNYLLPSVAVVVLGGTSLLGGRGFPVATMAAALFLTQLDQFTLALGVPYAARTLVQAIALALGVAIYTVNWGTVARKLRPAPEKTSMSPA